jgi:hypothetical protein
MGLPAEIMSLGGTSNYGPDKYTLIFYVFEKIDFL